MTTPRTSGLLAIGFLAALLTLGHAQAPSSVDAAFDMWWAARSPADAARVTTNIVKSGVTFDEAFQRLRRGRVYTAQKSGVVMATNRTDDRIEHHYAVNVPPGYDPTRSYQVRFQLHGGVGGREDNQPRGTGEIGALAGSEQFYVIPYAWRDAPWWSDDQVLNLRTILDALKRTYNIDENRVVVAGVSDGGTGAYYLAMRDTTPYASFLPLNGFIMVLANGEIDNGRLYPNNLRNKPMFVINGGRDRLYPTAIVEPFVVHLKASGVDIAYYPQPEAGHNTAWWPEMKDSFERFVSEHPRQPHPEQLTWETAELSHNRIHWLVIDELGGQADDPKTMADVNAVRDSDELARFGAAGAMTLFEHRKPSGRVDATRTGNIVNATTRGVAALTVLLSPDAFDFSQPIKVVVNGRTRFEGRVERNLDTLLKWAARDNDRTMLYGAELKIRLR